MHTDQTTTIRRAIAARQSLIDRDRRAGLRLLNGFSEGLPELSIDLYAATAVLSCYAPPGPAADGLADLARAALLEQLPWLRAIVLKLRASPDPSEQAGRLIHGERPDRRLREHGVWYAFHPSLNRDASLYLDTRELRAWALAELRGARVLNTFAYTGSLGVAARAGGAAEVTHVDQSRAYLNIAKESYSLNGLPIERRHFLAEDFFRYVARARRSGQLFDCVFLDPPFFAEGDAGTVDAVAHYGRLLNKVRPLVAHGGRLVALNNALFLSGADFLAELGRLGADGYMELERTIPVPPDCVGLLGGAPDLPADPAPFTHPTKIAVLRLTRKDGAAARAAAPGPDSPEAPEPEA